LIKNLGAYTEKHMKKRNINVLTKVHIKEVKQNSIILDDGTTMPFGVCVWSTGNTPCGLIKSLVFKKDRAGRLLVDDHLNILDYDNIYAIGDCSSQEKYNFPQTAQCANQEGAYLAKLFKKIQNGQDLKSIKFKYINRGMMSYIGGYQSIIGLNTVQGYGFFAWFLWRSAYLTRLFSFKNMILVPMYWFKTFVFGRDISSF